MSRDVADLPKSTMVDIDLRRLRYFVAIANESSYVRAAAALYMTQPALSRQILALEKDLGVTLFDRGRWGVALTAPGHQLLEDARAILASSMALQRRLRLAARADLHFTVGITPGVLVTEIIAQFASAAPDLLIHVVHTSLANQVDFLLDGRVDVCFVRLPIPHEGLKLTPLFPEPRVAALPPAHPLADAAVVAVDQLERMTLLQDPDDVPEWTGTRSLHPSQQTTVIEEQLEQVASGQGFAVVPAGLADFYQRPDVKYVPLTGVAPRTVALAQCEHRHMPELRRFTELASKTLGPPSG